jgi:two-component system response regulator FixJ
MAGDPISTENNTEEHRETIVCVVEPNARETQRIEAVIAAVGATGRLYHDGTALLADPSRHAVCVISEMSLPDMNGAELIAALRARGDHTPVILLAEQSDVASAVSGIRAGALDYLDKSQMDRLLRLRLQRLIHEDGSDARQEKD